MLARSKIINNCNGTVTLNTEGNIKDFFNTTITTHKVVDPEEFLKEFKQNLNNFKFNSEPVVIDTLGDMLNQNKLVEPRTIIKGKKKSKD